MKNKLTKVCAWCGRMKTNNGKWIVMGLGTDKNISHGICPRCKRKWLKRAGLENK
jgi:Zn-finger nucleic acid-binding protein